MAATVAAPPRAASVTDAPEPRSLSTRKRAGGPGYPLFDVDLHTTFRRASDLLPYLPARYQQRFKAAGVGDSPATFFSGAGGNREDAVAPDGSPAGTSAPFVAQQLLDPYNIEYAVCTGNNILGLGTIPDPDYAAALARAHNDWTLNTWLPQERRFLGAVVIAQQDPAQAVAEIERVGSHPRMVEVVLSSGNVAPFGQRRYHPIYEACARMGLPLAIHPGTEGRSTTTPPTSVGYPARRLEWHTNLSLNYMAHAVSFICEGVFAKIPDFRLILLEGGVSWVAPLLWQLDSDWKALRQEVPHLRELPSTYFRRHIMLSSQPIEEPESVDDLIAAWELCGAADLVMFSSDYPHWDSDDPYAAIPACLPAEWKRKIYRDNARALFHSKLAALQRGRKTNDE